MTTLEKILSKKYGREIMELLVNSGRLTIPNVDHEHLKSLAATQMNSFIHEGFLTTEEYDIFKNRGWGLDFSGWLGEMNPEKGRKYMIIGVEPHIVHPQLIQVVYDFFSKKDMKDSERAEELFHTGHPLWKRVSELIYENPKRKAEILMDCYIADICHFAPFDIGSADTIKQKVPRWKRIRSRVADRYLIEEIQALEPSVIIAQGQVAFQSVQSLFNIRNRSVQVLNEYAVGPKKKLFVRYFKLSEVTVIGVPHMGTSFNINRKFWDEHTSLVREDLIKNKLLPASVFV